MKTRAIQRSAKRPRPLKTLPPMTGVAAQAEMDQSVKIENHVDVTLAVDRRAPVVEPTESAWTRRAVLLGALGTVAYAAFTGTALVQIKADRDDDHRREAMKEGNFSGFCELLREGKFDAAKTMAQTLAYAADANEERGLSFVWQANACISDALSGNPASCISLTAVLAEAVRWGAGHKGYGDFLYAAASDLIYINMLFFRVNPSKGGTSFEKEAYKKMVAMVPVNFERLMQQQYCCLHLFELSPGWTIEVPKIDPSFLHCKVLALKGDYHAALEMMQTKTIPDWSWSEEVSVATKFAEAMLLASVGRPEDALRSAGDSNYMNAIRDEDARAHMDSVFSLFRNRPDELANKLQTQSTLKRHLLGFVANADCWMFLGGPSAKSTRQEYARAAQYGYSKADFQGADHLRRLIADVVAKDATM